MKRNIFILLIAVSILFVFLTSVFASETIDVKDYIKGKFPIMFNIYLASLEGLDQYEKEFIDLLQNLPEEEQKNFAKEVYNNGFSKEILAKIKDVLLLNVPLFLEGAVGEKSPEKSFTWDPREELIVITAGNGVEGFNEFIIELDKVLPGVSGWGSGSILDFTENERDLEKMINNHTILMIRPKNIKELEKLEAEYPELVPLSCSKLKSCSFPLLYFSRDDKGKIRGVIITNKVTPLLVKLLTKGELPLNIPFWFPTETPSVDSSEKFSKETESFRWKKREEVIIITAGNEVEGRDEFVDELRKAILSVPSWGSRYLIDSAKDKLGLERMRKTHTIFTIRPENIEQLEKLDAEYPELVHLSYSKLKSYSFPLLYFSRDDNGKIRGVIIANEVTPSLAKLLTKDALPLDITFWYEDGQLKEIVADRETTPFIFSASLETAILKLPLSIISVSEGKQIGESLAEFCGEMRKFLNVSIHSRPSPVPVGKSLKWLTSNTIYFIHPKNLKCLQDLEAKYPQLLPLSYNELESKLDPESLPLCYFSRDIEADKIRGIVVAYHVDIALAKLLSKDVPLDTFFQCERGQWQILE